MLYLKSIFCVPIMKKKCYRFLIMSSANLLGYLNVLDNSIIVISNQILKIENEFNELKECKTFQNEDKKHDEEDKKFNTELTKLAQKSEFFNTRIDGFSNDISEIKKELKENSNFIPKVEQLINKCIKERLEINNNFMSRQIKALQDQIDSIQKSIDISQNIEETVNPENPVYPTANPANPAANLVTSSIQIVTPIITPTTDFQVVENPIDNESSKKKRGYNRKLDEKVKQLNIE